MLQHFAIIALFILFVGGIQWLLKFRRSKTIDKSLREDNNVKKAV